MRIVFLTAAGLALVALRSAAQEPTPPPAQPAGAPAACPPGYTCSAASSPATALGLYVFPAKEQT